MRYQTITLVVEWPEDGSWRDPDDWNYDELLDTRARVIHAWPTEADELELAFGSGEREISHTSGSDGGPSDEDEYVARCPACGEPIDYCQGHGEIGDPAGHAILRLHDKGDHWHCDPKGCEDAPKLPT